LVQYNQVTTAGSFASSSDKRVHFGLGADKRIKEIELRWPSGTVQILRNVKELDEIPKLLAGLRNAPPTESFWKTVEPEALGRLLGVKSRTDGAARRIS